MIGIVLSNGESGVSERKERINTRARRGEEAQSTQRNDGRSGAQRVAPLGETALRRDPTQPGGRAGRRRGRVSVRHQNEYNVCRCSREATMAGEKILTLRLEGGLRGKLDKLAAATRRSRSFLAAEAIREYVALNSWQIEEIHKGLAEAERGEFASENEVKRVAKKWTRRAR